MCCAVEKLKQRLLLLINSTSCIIYNTQTAQQLPNVCICLSPLPLSLCVLPAAVATTRRVESTRLSCLLPQTHRGSSWDRVLLPCFDCLFNCWQSCANAGRASKQTLAYCADLCATMCFPCDSRGKVEVQRAVHQIKLRDLIVDMGARPGQRGWGAHNAKVVCQLQSGL